MSEPLTTGEKVETAAFTLVLLVLIALAFGCGVGVFYFLIWGLR